MSTGRPAGRAPPGSRRCPRAGRPAGAGRGDRPGPATATMVRAPASTTRVTSRWSRRRSPPTGRQPVQVDQDLRRWPSRRCRPVRTLRRASRRRAACRRAARRCAIPAGTSAARRSRVDARAPRPARSGRPAARTERTSYARPAGPVQTLPQGHRVVRGHHPARGGRGAAAASGRRRPPGSPGRSRPPATRRGEQPRRCRGRARRAIRSSCSSSIRGPSSPGPGHAEQHRGGRDVDAPAGGAGARVDDSTGPCTRRLVPPSCAPPETASRADDPGEGDHVARAPPLRRRRWPATGRWCWARPGPCAPRAHQHQAVAGAQPVGRASLSRPASSAAPSARSYALSRADGLRQQLPVLGERERVGRADPQAEQRGQRRAAAARPRPPTISSTSRPTSSGANQPAVVGRAGRRVGLRFAPSRAQVDDDSAPPNVSPPSIKGNGWITKRLVDLVRPLRPTLEWPAASELRDPLGHLAGDVLRGQARARPGSRRGCRAGGTRPARRGRAAARPRPASRSALGDRVADAAGADAVLDGHHEPVLPRPGRPARSAPGAPSAGRPRSRRSPARRAARRPPRPGGRTRRPRPAARPCARPRAARRPADPAQRRAGRPATEPVGKRTIVGPSSIATASRSSSRSVAASRGAAIRRPGTTPKTDMSQMP